MKMPALDDTLKTYSDILIMRYSVLQKIGDGRARKKWMTDAAILISLVRDLEIELPQSDAPLMGSGGDQRQS